ncbi:MAG: hypothetical protein DRQ02_11745 [Candidatus Latescibacterota bacterium]|nr:MAG: hypothetical protein DRQ02_11745 [Candidatus Latescibacterota bacterium]
MLKKQLLAAVHTLLLLAVVLMPWEAFGQEGNFSLELLWEKTLDSPIRYRVMNEWIPDIGIDTTVSEGENPVRMVATERSIYIFDNRGDIKLRVPLKRDTKTGKIAEVGTVSPGGEYFAIVNVAGDEDYAWYEEVKVFDKNGNLKFKIKGETGMPYFSPNGEFLVLFFDDAPGLGERKIKFYDLEGNLRKAVDLPPGALRIDFSKGGSRVEIYNPWRGGLVYDARGNKVGERTKAQQRLEREKKKKGLPFSFTQKAKEKIWRNKTKGVGKLIEEEDKTGIMSVKTITARMGQGVISKDGKFGFISDGNVLYCFQINNNQGAEAIGALSPKGGI